MSLNKTQISNLALGHVGVSFTLSNLSTDQSNQAKIIRNNFNSSLTHLLEKYAWGFASKIEALALVEECPDSGTYAFSYRAPTDSVIIQKVGIESFLRDTEDHLDERNKFEEMFDEAGTLINTDIGLAFAKYTKALDPDSLFPNHFARALSAQLAMDIAPNLITNNFSKVKRLLMSDMKEMINDGIAADLNRKPRPDASDSVFVRARM